MSEIFLIECAGTVNGRRHTWFPERDCDRLSWGVTIRDIMDGQVEHIARVYRADDEDCSWTDVSREAAEEILSRLEYSPREELRDWIENQLGVFTTAHLKEAA